MREIGFWDYSCSTHGSLERYTAADWDLLLDDCAAGGFNSFVLCPKWLTTGYRSRLPWLDQDPLNSAVASDNAVLHHAFQGMRQRGIKPWLLVVSTQYQIAPFNLGQPASAWGAVGNYDLDHRGLEERIVELYGELMTLFGGYLEGIVVELEFCDTDAPHRVDRYNAWAKAHGRPDFATIKNIALEPRGYPFLDWRDYTTSRRAAVLQRIAATVLATRFQGRLATLVEVGNAPGVLVSNVNWQALRDALPEWTLVTYDSIYDRSKNRLATMDFCVEQPHRLGWEVAYLSRGVMTFGENWNDVTLQLPEQWRMTLEDARTHQPELLWFMGSDARLDGLVCSNVKLPRWGFPDGRTARRALMKMAREMGVVAG